jgi:hypothetical protein
LLPSAILHFFALRNVAGGVNEAIFGFCATKKKRWWRQRSPWKRSAPPPKSNAITSVDYSAHTLFTYNTYSGSRLKRRPRDRLSNAGHRSKKKSNSPEVCVQIKNWITLLTNDCFRFVQYRRRYHTDSWVNGHGSSLEKKFKKKY